MFQQDYSAQHLTYFGIPPSILPKVVTSQSSTKFGYIDRTIFEDPDLSNVNDFKLPITAVLADQGASAFGLNWVNKGDIYNNLLRNLLSCVKSKCKFQGPKDEEELQSLDSLSSHEIEY